MQKRFFKIILITFLIVIFLSTICFASSVAIVDEINFDKKLVKISGNLDNAIKNDRINFQVFYPNKNPNDLTALNILEYIQYSDVLTANATGGYLVNFSLSDNAISGIYKFRAKKNNDTSWTEGSFFYATPEYGDELAGKLDNPIGATQTDKINTIKEILADQNSIQTLNLDLIYYNNISDKQKVYEQILKSDFNGKRAEFIKLFNEIVAARFISETSLVSDVTSILNYYKQDLDIVGLSAYTKYIDAKFDSKRAIMNHILMNNELYKATDISIILKIEMLNILVSDIVRWEQYEGYLKDLNDYLTLDFSIYDTLTNKMPVITAMINNGRFDTIEQVKTKFITAVNAQKNVEDTPKKPQSSGGSGSSGGISVSPQPMPTSTPTQEQLKTKFTDVDTSFWGFDAVNFLSEKGVINGFEDGSFKPNEKITREQFAKIIAVAFSLNSNNLISNFSDISVDSWSYPYVSAVFGSGAMKGITENYFGANQNVTREQMATIVYRASKNANITLEKTREVSYTDEFQISDYAKESILALSGAEIINGTKNGYFEPKELCTRVQIAKILYEVLGGK